MAEILTPEELTSKINSLQKSRNLLIQQRLDEIEVEIENLVFERDFLTERLRDKAHEPARIIENEILSRLHQGTLLPAAGSRNPEYKEALRRLAKRGLIKNLDGRKGAPAKWVLTGDN